MLFNLSAQVNRRTIEIGSGITTRLDLLITRSKWNREFYLTSFFVPIIWYLVMMIVEWSSIRIVR